MVGRQCSCCIDVRLLQSVIEELAFVKNHFEYKDAQGFRLKKLSLRFESPLLGVLHQALRWLAGSALVVLRLVCCNL